MVDKLYIIRPVVKFDNKRFKEEFERDSSMKYDNKGIWDYIYEHYPEVNEEIKKEQELYYQEQKAFYNFQGTKKEAIEQAKKQSKKDWLEFPEIYFDRAILDLETAGLLSKYQKGKRVAVEGKQLSYRELRNLRKQDAGYYVKIENDTTRDGRNNIIFDTIYAMLTSEQAMDQIFTPGNFDEPKKYGYIAEAVRVHPEMSYEDILRIYEQAEQKEAGSGVDALKDLISKSKNLVYNNVHLAFHKQNMVAGKLIGIFAQNNVSHSIISLIDQSVKTDAQGNILHDVAGKPKIWKPTILIEEPVLEIEGNTIGGEEVPFDTLEDKQGKRISNTLAAFLAASVDAVKDPVLNFMNINETTAGILTSLVRMGYDTELAMLFLTQPIIKETITKYAIENEEGYKSLDQLIQETINSLNEDDIDISSLAIPSLSKKNLIKTLRGATSTESINLLRALKALNDISRVTSAIVSITKFNSVTAAAGPMLSNTLLMKQRVYENLGMKELQTESMRKALNNPIIKSFREAEFDAVEFLFRDMMLQANPQFSRILSRVQEVSNGRIDDSMVNKLADFYIAFLLASTENPIFKTADNNNPISESRRKYIYKSLPWEIKKLQKTSDNRFLKLLRVMPADDSHEYYWLKLNTRGMNGTVHDDVGLYWQELYQENPELAMALIEYNFVTSGLGFTPNSFANLVPIALKRVIPNYIQLLDPDRMLNTEEEDRLIDQFVRNNHSNSKIVKRVGTIKKGITFGENYVLISNTISDIKKGDTYREYIMYNNILYKLAGEKADRVKYVQVSKLGGKFGEILEINPSGNVEHIDLQPKNKAKKNASTELKEKYSEEEVLGEVEVEDNSPKKKKPSVFNDMIAQIQWFILNKVPESEQKDRIARLNRAINAAKYGKKEAPETSLRALFNTYSENGFSESAFSQMTNIRNVVFNAVQGIKNIDQEDLNRKIKGILDTKTDLNICD